MASQANTQYLTLAPNTVSSATFTPTVPTVTVTNRNGAGEVFFTTDGSAPTIGGAGTYMVPAQIGAFIRVNTSLVGLSTGTTSTYVNMISTSSTTVEVDPSSLLQATGYVPTTSVGDLSAAGTISGNTSVPIVLSGQASVTVQLIASAFTGTSNFEVSNDGGSTYQAVALWPVGVTAAGNLVTSRTETAGTSTSLYEGNVSASSHFRVRGSGVTAGSVAVTVRAGLSTSSVVLDGPLPPGNNVIGQVGVTTLPALPAGANAIGTVGVTALPPIPAGANAIGTVGVTSLPALSAGAAAIGTVGVTALPAIPAGANAIGTVGVTALPALPAGANAIGSVTVSNLPASQTVATGIAVFTSLNAAAATANGTALDCTLPHQIITMQVNLTSTTAPTAISTQLQASLDNVNFFNIGTALTATASGTTFTTSSGTPARYFRAATTITGGTAVSCTALLAVAA